MAVGFHDLQFAKSGGFYKFWIDGVAEYQRPASDIDTCWGYIEQTDWISEMLNTGDQGGGPNSNHQGYLNNEWEDTGGWHFLTRQLGAGCNRVDYPTHYHCQISTTSGEDYAAWDDRFP